MDDSDTFNGADGGAFAHADLVLDLLAQAVGPGLHIITCSVTHPCGGMVTSTDVPVQDGVALLDSVQRLPLTFAMTYTMLTDSKAGIICRSESADGTVIRGWHLARGRFTPLSAARVRDAYNTDPETGEHLPLEADVTFLPGLPLDNSEATATDESDSLD